MAAKKKVIDALPALRDSRVWRTEARTRSKLEASGFQVVLRVAPSQKAEGSPENHIRMIAMSRFETRLIIVRIDEPLSRRERAQIKAIRSKLPESASIHEWIWRERDRFPEVVEIA